MGCINLRGSSHTLQHSRLGSSAVMTNPGPTIIEALVEGEEGAGTKMLPRGDNANVEMGHKLCKEQAQSPVDAMKPCNEQGYTL